MKEEKDMEAAFEDFIRGKIKESVERGIDASCLETFAYDRLFFSMRGAHEAGFTEHPQKVMELIGIKYSKAEPNTLTDSWTFYDCSNAPALLPKFLHE